MLIEKLFFTEDRVETELDSLSTGCLTTLLATTSFLLRDGGFFLVRKQVRQNMSLLRICVRTHILTEYVALVRLKNLLVPECEQLPIS